MELVAHCVVVIPVLPSRNGACARGSSVIADVWFITDIREGVPLKTVGTVLGLPATCMKSFGLIDCSLCSNVVDIKATNSHCQVNTGRTGTTLVMSCSKTLRCWMASFCQLRFKASLTGLTLDAQLKPSHALVDHIVAMVEEQSIYYVDLSLCAS